MEKHRKEDGTFDDRSFLLDQSSWPVASGGDPDFPVRYCCLKYYGKDKDHPKNGFLLNADNPIMDGKIILSIGYIGEGGTGQVVEYDSIDHILESGWIVD